MIRTTRPCCTLLRRGTAKQWNSFLSSSSSASLSLCSTMPTSTNTTCAVRFASTTIAPPAAAGSTAATAAKIPSALDLEDEHPDLSAVDPIDLVQRGCRDASLVLPNQGILENFVHQNPLQNFEEMPFKEAVEYTHHLETFMSPAERCFKLLNVDPRKRINEAMAELSAIFLDRGAAKWSPPHRDKGFLYFFASLEGLGFSPWRHTARQYAKKILAEHNRRNREGIAWTEEDTRRYAASIIEEHLHFLGYEREEWTDTIRSFMLAQRGWASMFRRMEAIPSEMPADTSVRLIEMVAVRCIITRSAITSLAMMKYLRKPEDITAWLRTAPKNRHAGEAKDDEHEHTKHHVSSIANESQEYNLRETFEHDFKHTLIEAIGTRDIPKPSTTRPKVQVWTCIDDRMESLRRHIEECNPENIETFGLAGFFGVPMRYAPLDGRDEMVQGPFGVQPSIKLVETCADGETAGNKWKQQRAWMAKWIAKWEIASFSPIKSLVLSGLFAPLLVVRLWMMCFTPLLMRELLDKVRNTLAPPVRTTFELPMSAEEAARILNNMFAEIGTAKRFAPLVFIIAHGNTSTNNPFAAAYNCGACQGHDGGPNARVVARMGNDESVRAILKSKYSVIIPSDTVFIAADHNTCTDEIEFFDTEVVPEMYENRFLQATSMIQKALGKNAWERCYRFLLARPSSAKEALRHVKRRSIDYSEVRPELNHATNAAVVVGRRDLTKGRFLDRRVFLPSYDPYCDDDRGTNLERVLTPSLVVCSGINLEYLFSTADVDGHGAGTKVPLNIVGNIGVLQGVCGDLHPGLPSQMTEMHTPIRAHFVVDAPVERVEAVLARNKRLMNLVRNEWVRLFVRDPTTQTFYKQVQGKYLVAESRTTETCVSFESQYHHGLKVAQRENYAYYVALLSAVACCVGPIAHHYHLVALAHHEPNWDALMERPEGAIAAICATAVTLPTLAFARRYLHGEYMFTTFSMLCVGLLLGFNLVATAPDLHHALSGWTLFGFASAFLIGSYNERPTVRSNATYAFSAYKLGDYAMLLAAACTSHIAYTAIPGCEQLAALGLLLAAFFKSSQFPLSVLFARSMEGPTPSSALGYAGLSAHIGIVLLATTTQIWYPFWWARGIVFLGGAFTAIESSFVSRIRPDRKGAVAYATSASLGVLFAMLAAGVNTKLILFVAFGHATFRMIQILRAPNLITDYIFLKACLGGQVPWPSKPPEWLYRLAWRSRRFDTDFHLLNVFEAILRPGSPRLTANRMRFPAWAQWLLTIIIVVIAGFPFTPYAHLKEELIVETAHHNPKEAVLMFLVDFGLSVALMKILFSRVLDKRRFQMGAPGMGKKGSGFSGNHHHQVVDAKPVRAAPPS